MDIIFDALDTAMERLRERHPRAVLVTGLVVWLAGAGLVAYALSELSVSWFGLAFYLALPLGLTGATAIWGLGGLGWPLWPIGVSPVVFAGGFFSILDQTLPGTRQTSGLALVLIASVLGYVYVQIFLSALVSIDEYRKRRLAARGRADHPGADRRARRRVLQLKLLLTIMIMAVDISGADFDSGNWLIGRRAPGPLLVLALCGVALFARQPWSAWSAAGLLGLMTAAYAVSAVASRHLSDIAGVGWAGLVGAYLFAKAARRDYWPLGSAIVVSTAIAPPREVLRASGRTAFGPTSALGVTSLAISIAAAVGCCGSASIAGSFGGVSWQAGTAGAAGMAGLIGAVSGHLALRRISRHGLPGSRAARTGLALGWIIAVAGLLYASYFLDAQHMFPSR